MFVGDNAELDMEDMKFIFSARVNESCEVGDREG